MSHPDVLFVVVVQLVVPLVVPLVLFVIMFPVLAGVGETLLVLPWT